MENKKAWLRIVEAFIAIVLIASVLAVIYIRSAEKPKSKEEIYQLQKIILIEIASDIELRTAALNNETEIIKEFVKKRIPPAFNFDILICKIGDICGLDFYVGEEGKDVYSSERAIAADLQQYSPKKIKIFMWRK